jgi:hypothetical protein
MIEQVLGRETFENVTLAEDIRWVILQCQAEHEQTKWQSEHKVETVEDILLR